MIRFKLYAVIILIFNLVLLFGQKDVVNTSEKRDSASTNHRGIPCATPDPTVDQIIQSKAELIYGSVRIVLEIENRLSFTLSGTLFMLVIYREYF